MADPVLRPYDPTWRDRLAASLLGDDRPSPERRRLVEGLLGSSGTGNTGAGLIDFTPAGIPLAGQEAKRDAAAGDWKGAMLNAMAVAPALKPEAAAAKAGLRAYHGSPHSFDRFDLSKVGTGEGAQAYGHGVYLAENEGVAKSYRDALTAPGAKGHMYEANVKADPEKMIDWDAIGSTGYDLPATVKDAASQKIRSFYGPNFHYDNVNEVVQRKFLEKALMDPVVTKNLAEQGVPGIKYLDQTSRAEGEGTRNFVIFDDKNIDVLRKYGLTGLLGGGAAAQAIPQQPE